MLVELARTTGGSGWRGDVLLSEGISSTRVSRVRHHGRLFHLVAVDDELLDALVMKCDDHGMVSLDGHRRGSDGIQNRRRRIGFLGVILKERLA